MGHPAQRCIQVQVHSLWKFGFNPVLFDWESNTQTSKPPGLLIEKGFAVLSVFVSTRELTLFWSKLLKRLESSEQDFLERCRKMSMLSKTVFHILFLIKVVQSEVSQHSLTCVDQKGE